MDVLVALAMLRRRINSHESPIYRLHSELLLLIASRLAKGDLIKATHISYHWREVLLAHPSLWSTIEFSQYQSAREQAATFFSRSKSATIHVSLPTTGSAAELELLKQSTDRIATLRVGNYRHQKELLLRVMPSLKKLDLYSHELDDSLLRDGASLHFPVLETLSVKDNDLPPLSAPRLTRFNFSNIWAEPQSVDRLLCLLSNCPLLEELSVQLICDPDAPINHDVVHLPHLRVYTHVTETTFYPSLFDMLSCPSTCSVTFAISRCTCRIESSLPPLEKPVPLVHPGRIRLKARGMNREDSVEGTVKIVDAANRRFRLTQQVTLDYLAWDEVLGCGINSLLTDLIKDLDRNFAETLCAEEGALWFCDRRRCVEEVLDHLENIKTLIICDSAIGPFLDALAPPEAADTDELRCPKLESLVIYTKNGDPTGEEIIEPIFRVARKRSEAGFPFESVSLFSPQFENLGDPNWIGPDLEEMRKWIGSFKLVTGEDAMDWNVDEYFLDGLHGIRRDWEHTKQHEFASD